MGRPARLSLSYSATIRHRLGLTREELGLLLGVGERQVGHVEAGRRGYSATAQERLRRLATLLPPSDAAPTEPEAAPPVPVAGPTPEEAAALRKRLRNCRHHLYQLRYQEAGPAARAEQLQRRRHTLTRLAEALAQPPADPADPAVRPEREQQWLELLALGTRRLEYRQPTPTALGWRALKVELLEAEIRGLEALLGENLAPPEPPAG
jgi:transcriptional regulator with XRE-family HTH domain